MSKIRLESHYWNNHKPTKIYWKVIAGPGRLSQLQEYDLAFGKQDEKFYQNL